MIFKILLAYLFRLFFCVPFFKKHFFGMHQKWFQPLHLFRGIRIKKKLLGSIIFELNIDDWIPQNLFFLGSYEETELSLFRRLIKDKKCFIDIGANIGLYALTAANEMSDDAQIIAFEPFQVNNDSLQKNVSLNQFHNIQIEKKAISNQNKELILYYDTQEDNLGSVSALSIENVIEEKVQAISLDEYVIQNDISNIEFIKMDIEGLEYLALQGMKVILEKYHPIILIEIDPEILSKTDFTSEMIEQFLNQFGYQKYFIDSKGELSLDSSVQNAYNYLFSVDKI